MKENIYILFTAGRGPVECSLAVQGIQARFKKYLDNKNIAFGILNQKKGSLDKSMETIVFKVNTTDQSIVKPWLGTIQWICQSPIRKFHKRKNWFIKCKQIEIADTIDVDTKEVTVQSFRASGPGGQHRNKVETAIRLIHKASGLIVTATDGKSQIQNKKKAWQKLNEKLKLKNAEMIQDQNSEVWTTQLQIERGSPVKTFFGEKFKE